MLTEIDADRDNPEILQPIEAFFQVDIDIVHEPEVPEAERQALALMDHSSIARAYDAGATDHQQLISSSSADHGPFMSPIRLFPVRRLVYP